MSAKISIDLAKHRLGQAKESLEDSEILYNLRRYKSANNRAYYSIFYSIKPDITQDQIETAEELLKLAEEYIKNYKKN